jgi:hypothetical protein
MADKVKAEAQIAALGSVAVVRPSPLRALEHLELELATSEPSSSTSHDLDDDLQRILDDAEDDGSIDELLDAQSFTSPERRREELDKILERADALAAMTTRSLESAQLELALQARSRHGSRVESPRPQMAAALEAEAAAAAAAAAAASDGAEHGAAKGLENPLDKPLRDVGSLADAEAAERRTLAAGSERAAPEPIRSGASPSGTVEERRQLGLELLRVVPLEQMAKEVADHLERGRPTAIAMNASCVAVGTSHGHVLVFDRRQTLRTTLWLYGGAGGPTASAVAPPTAAPSWASSAPRTSLGSTLSSTLSSKFIGAGASISGAKPSAGTPGPAIDAVSAVRLAENASLLLAGHASGALVLWDLATVTILKACPSLHDKSICHIRMLHPYRPFALTCDAGGTTHLVTFSRSMVLSQYTVSRQCLLDGAAGVVTALELLTNFLPPPAGAGAGAAAGGTGGIALTPRSREGSVASTAGEFVKGAASVASSAAAMVSSSSNSSKGAASVAAAAMAVAAHKGSSATSKPETAGTPLEVEDEMALETARESASLVAALCTPKVTFVIRLTPKVELLQRLTAPASSPARPLNASSPSSPISPRLAWRPADGIDCARLALSWGTQLQLLQLTTPVTAPGLTTGSGGSGAAAAAAAAAALVATPKLEMSATCSLRVPVCGLEWLSDGVLLLLDVTMMVRGALEAALEPRSARRSHSNH